MLLNNSTAQQRPVPSNSCSSTRKHSSLFFAAAVVVVVVFIYLFFHVCAVPSSAPAGRTVEARSRGQHIHHNLLHHRRVIWILSFLRCQLCERRSVASSSKLICVSINNHQDSTHTLCVCVRARVCVCVCVCTWRRTGAWEIMRRSFDSEKPAQIVHRGGRQPCLPAEDLRPPFIRLLLIWLVFFSPPPRTDRLADLPTCFLFVSTAVGPFFVASAYLFGRPDWLFLLHNSDRCSTFDVTVSVCLSKDESAR